MLPCLCAHRGNSPSCVHPASLLVVLVRVLRHARAHALVIGIGIGRVPTERLRSYAVIRSPPVCAGRLGLLPKTLSWPQPWPVLERASPAASVASRLMGASPRGSASDLPQCAVVRPHQLRTGKNRGRNPGKDLVASRY